MKRISLPAAALALMTAAFLLTAVTLTAQETSLIFATEDHGSPGTKAPVVEPWRSITLDPEYGGMWVVTGDLDADGEAEIISARNVNNDDVHYTSAVAAQKLDGSILWQWGDPSIGRRNWHHDVACQVYDWDGDSWSEVILLTKGRLVELDGFTGEERRSFAIPEDATDCLVFCNVSGKKRPTDVIVKNRYDQIWVYNYGGELLWTVKQPGGYRTAHQPLPFDIDGDGKDEIMAGYSMLNADGSVRWTISSAKTDLSKGHLDCCRVLRFGKEPKEWQFVMTYCGANCLACVDGLGNTLWENTGYHFESINIGRMFSAVEGPQIAVDIDHVPQGKSPVWLFDYNGKRLATIESDYCRHHELFDWNADGYADLFIADALGVFGPKGMRIATLGCPEKGVALQTGDMDGDGVIDMGVTTENGFYIFRNTTGIQASDKKVIGCGVNYTFY